MDDYAGSARLREATDVAIAGGELNGHGLPVFRMMLEKGCLDWYQPDAVFTGGVAATWAIARSVRAAGAVYEPGLAARWRKLGLEPRAALQANDAAGFFGALDALLVTGPTLTNVNDFRALLLQPSAWDAG